MKCTVVIPVYQPSPKIIDYIKSLKDEGLDDILVVDDGSGQEYERSFKEIEDAGVLVLRHGVNLGKGRALKTAFNYIMVVKSDVEVVVTTDGDGTYLPEDVKEVAENARENAITLGCRDYSSEKVHPKLRRNNHISHLILLMLAGIRMSDTQTGLRSYPAALLPYLITTLGERYDYEFNMIFDKKKIELNEVPVSITSRMADKKTHFRAVKDSWIIISAFLIFIIISLSSTILDLFLYNWFIAIFDSLLPIFYISIATFLARAVSDTYNYYLDKKLVFKADETSNFGRYVMLALAKTAASAIFVTILVLLLGDGELWFKIVVDTIIFFVAYRIEKSWVHGQ